MEKLSKRKAAILDVIDEQIEELEEKLAPYQKVMDELNQLRRTRATLLNERTSTGSVGSRTRLSMESVIQALRENDNEAMTPGDVASKLGVDPTVVRSHFNRHADTRYRKNGDGWELIGEDDEGDE